MIPNFGYFNFEDDTVPGDSSAELKQDISSRDIYDPGNPEFSHEDVNPVSDNDDDVDDDNESNEDDVLPDDTYSPESTESDFNTCFSGMTEYETPKDLIQSIIEYFDTEDAPYCFNGHNPQLEEAATNAMAAIKAVNLPSQYGPALAIVGIHDTIVLCDNSRSMRIGTMRAVLTDALMRLTQVVADLNPRNGILENDPQLGRHVYCMRGKLDDFIDREEKGQQLSTWLVQMLSVAQMRR
ncbi:hypothetical protein AJ79_06016 [Helicocarpus griseus UAMH5409]|uniref:Uncharacterized protein n=1 Tax=Helicocarpus griseus UAMH5409 TaxID=1447875 RepID=A0A2B7XHF1_9EURO|nr:hypothetical protein AJ79_06016 [Helicocarpus griseus UAMH5409]